MAEVYQRVKRLKLSETEARAKEKSITVSVQDMPLAEFLRWLSVEAGVSVIAGKSLDDDSVTLDMNAVPVDQVLGVVARRLGVQVSRTGRVYFLGDLRPEDRGVLVRRVARLTGDELRGVVGVLLSEHGRMESHSDGLIVVGDRVEVLQRVIELCDRIEDVPVDTWVVQLHVIAITDNASSRMGVDVVPALELSYSFASGSAAGAAASGVNLFGELDGILQAARRVEGVSMVAEPLFLLTDGGSGSFKSGEVIPVARKSVSAEGTVETLDFQYVNVGLDFEVQVRQVAPDAARLRVRMESGQLRGFVEGAPRVQRDEYLGEVAAVTGGVYLIGSVDRKQRLDAVDGAFRTVKETERQNDTLQIWGRVYRISGPPPLVGGDRIERPGERSESPPKHDDNTTKEKSND